MKPVDLKPVAQVSDLLYRRLPAGKLRGWPNRAGLPSAYGLEIGDTCLRQAERGRQAADWQSALQSGLDTL